MSQIVKIEVEAGWTTRPRPDVLIRSRDIRWIHVHGDFRDRPLMSKVLPERGDELLPHTVVFALHGKKHPLATRSQKTLTYRWPLRALSSLQPTMLTSLQSTRGQANSTCARNSRQSRVSVSLMMRAAADTGISRINHSARASNALVKALLKPSHGGVTR